MWQGFRKLGEPEFRRVEHEVVAEACRIRRSSTGGGAVVTPETRELLANHVVVRLDLPVDDAMKRLAGNRSRPLLNVPDPRAAYEKLLAQRACMKRWLTTPLGVAQSLLIEW